MSEEKYDEKGNLIYYKSYDGSFWRYDENDKYVYGKNLGCLEYWKKYDESGRIIEITEQEFRNIEFRIKEKEYLSREKCSRFEIMDI